MSTLFYRDARLFALAILLILAAGASALMTIGRQEDPTITNLFATIVTPFPGADPARVEAQVTEKIEEELREIPEIDEITSVSRSGISVITVELSQFISDTAIEQAWSEIRDALGDAAVNLPPGVPAPDFDDDRTGAFTAIVALQPRPGIETNRAILARYADMLQDRLRAVLGTKFVKLYGAQDEEIGVTLNRTRLESLGLTARSVAQAIAGADAKVRAGVVRGDKTDLLIEVEGQIRALDRLRAIPVRQGEDGRIVRLGDIATVKRDVRQPPANLALIEGREGVLVAARMEDDLQVDAWASRIGKALDGFEADMPGGLQLHRLFDQSAYTSDRLAGVLTNMLIGMGLVISVLLITLGWRAALVVATVIPLAGLMSVFGLQLVGIPIHQMSVTGLIVALGLLVDAAIVMTDEIRKKLVAGQSRLQAVDYAVRRLFAPLIASTVTTVLAFMPMVLLPGPAGDFVGAIAMAVIIMLLSSLALAVTLTPALAGFLLKVPERSTRGGWLTNGVSFKRAGAVFHASLRLALAHPILAILFALILPIIGFGAFPTLKPQFFPGVDRNQFYVQVKLPDGSAIRQSERVAHRVDAILKAEPGITEVTWVIGQSAPAFYYNMVANQDGEPSFAEALVTTESAQATEAILDSLQRTLDTEVPDARVIVRGLVQGPPVNAPVEIRVVGYSLETLREIGDEIRRLMLGVPGITLVRTEIASGAPKLSIALSEEKARLAGLNLGAIADQLEGRLEGALGGSLIEGSEELPVRVRLKDEARSTVEAVLGLDLVNPTAAGTDAYGGVPLTALGEVQVVPAETPIYRRDGERINTVQGFVERNVLPEVALAQVQDRIAASGLSLPPGYRLEVGGDADARDEVLRNLLGAVGLILALTIATIVLTFGSYRLSAITFIVAILSMGLSLLALAIFRYPFGIQAVIGVIGSIGVSINAAIIIITALQADAGALRGDARRIADIVMAQGRHIVSTTLTTFGGFVPLIMAGGGFWPPFAMSIAGGVLLSTVVSFYFVPPAFALLARRGTLPSRDVVAPAAGPALATRGLKEV
ncbi:MAG TPA: acriflavin resistance protein [Methyloceanibacter sp.]|nr:acriflavin resistance protein [Methyloceanibacter sp.]